MTKFEPFETSVLELNKTIAYQKLNAYYGQSTVFDVLGIERNENRHSAFLAWLFNPVSTHGLKEAPLRKFLSLVAVKASEVHKAAKALQRDLQTITDPNERKQMTKQMMELFVQSRSLKREANYRYFMERSIERDFRCMETDLED